MHAQDRDLRKFWKFMDGLSIGVRNMGVLKIKARIRSGAKAHFILLHKT